MKAVVNKKFTLERGCDFSKDAIINLSPEQFAELSSAGLVKEATKKQIKEWLDKKGSLPLEASETEEETVETSETEEETASSETEEETTESSVNTDNSNEESN